MKRLANALVIMAVALLAGDARAQQLVTGSPGAQVLPAPASPPAGTTGKTSADGVTAIVAHGPSFPDPFSYVQWTDAGGNVGRAGGKNWTYAAAASLPYSGTLYWGLYNNVTVGMPGYLPTVLTFSGFEGNQAFWDGMVSTCPDYQGFVNVWPVRLRLVPYSIVGPSPVWISASSLGLAGVNGGVVIPVGAGESFGVNLEFIVNLTGILDYYDLIRFTPSCFVSTSLYGGLWYRTVRVTTSAVGSGFVVGPIGDLGAGTTPSYTFPPLNSCWNRSDVRVDGSSIGPVASYQFAPLTADHTLAATFQQPVYTINASAGPGGTITPSGAVPVTCGNTQNFVVQPNACSVLSQVMVDGVPAGLFANYPFNLVQANHTISAVFNPKMYSITTSAGPGGSISPSGSIACGTDTTITITPDACHTIAWLLVDGDTLDPVANYRFTGVTGNRTIAAVFAPKPATLDVTVVGSGTVTRVPEQASYDCGTRVALRAVPDLGWEFAGWSGDTTATADTLSLVLSGVWQFTATFTSALGVGDPPVTAFGLSRVSPNPIRDVASIEFLAAHDAHASLRVLDLQGRTIAQLVDLDVPKGRHQVVWDTRGRQRPLAAGMYFLRYEVAGRAYLKRLVVTH